MELSRRARVVLLLSVLVTALLYVVPYGRYAAWPLMLLSTFAHEMGHGITAILCGGSFERFQMWVDGSGVAVHRGAGGALSSALVPAGGLVGPAILAALLFVLARRPRVGRVTLLLLGVLFAVADLLVVRNAFGAAFVGAVGALFILLAWKTSAETSQAVVIFVAVQLALSVFSRGDYLFTDVARTAGGTMPSDVAQMAKALVLPYWFWGALCGAFSVAVLLLGAWRLLRRGKPVEAARGGTPVG